LIHGTLAVSPSNIQSHVHLSASTTWRKIFGEENVSSYTLHICRSYVHGDKKKRVVWRQLVRTPVLTPNDVDQYKFWWIGIAFLLFLPLRHMLVRMCWTLYHRTKTLKWVALLLWQYMDLLMQFAVIVWCMGQEAKLKNQWLVYTFRDAWVDQNCRHTLYQGVIRAT
jgi:hypothetical protein